MTLVSPYKKELTKRIGANIGQADHALLRKLGLPHGSIDQITSILINKLCYELRNSFDFTNLDISNIAAAIIDCRIQLGPVSIGIRSGQGSTPTDGASQYPNKTLQASNRDDSTGVKRMARSTPNPYPQLTDSRGTLEKAKRGVQKASKGKQRS